MNVLIVECQAELAALWARPLVKWGHNVTIAVDQAAAAQHLCKTTFDVIILDLNLNEGSALAVADFANYRQPHAKVLAVSADRYFADGSIFSHLGNAQALLPRDTPAQDLGALAEYYAI